MSSDLLLQELTKIQGYILAVTESYLNVYDIMYAFITNMV